MTLRRVVGQNYLSSSDKTSSGTRTNTAIIAVLQDFKAHLVDGTVVQRNDRRATVAADGLSVAPTTTDEIILGGVTFRVENVTTKYVGADIAAYEMQLRQ